MALDLETFYRDHHRLVRWVARGANVPEASVDDVVQDVFVSAYHRRHAIPAGEERRWLVNMARGVCFSHRRSASRRRSRDADYAAATAVDSTELDDALDSRRALQRLWDGLQQLDESQRDAFIFIELAGMTTREVASMLMISPNTVSSRLRLARRKLETVPVAVREEARRCTEPSPSRARAVWTSISTSVWPKSSVLLGLAVVSAAALAGLGGGAAVLGRPMPQPLRSAMSRSLPQASLLPDTVRPRSTVGPIEIRGTEQHASRPRSMLSEEARWLARAAAALERSDISEAQRMLEAYARRFPHGELAPEHARLWQEHRRRQDNLRPSMTNPKTSGANRI